MSLDTGQGQVKLDELHESAENPRVIEPERLEALKKALNTDPGMLEARPVIATPEGEVVAGNMRLRAAKALGWSSIETFVIDLDPERKREWMMRDNNPYGEYVPDQVARLIELHQEGGGDSTLLGFTDENVRDMLESLKEGEAIIPDAEEPDEPELDHEVMIEVYCTHEAFNDGVKPLIDDLARIDGVEVNLSN